MVVTVILGFQHIGGGGKARAVVSADVNGDGRINSVDAMLILQAVAGLITLD